MTEFENLVKSLIERKYTISAAESCTGGLFSSGIVGIPDASKVLSASFVTYSEEAKNKFAFVPFAVIEKYGVVSEETARAMAKGAAKNADAQVGVGITGFAGPSGGDSFAEKGTVCFGFYINGSVFSAREQYKNSTRNEVRKKSAEYAAEYLNHLLDEN